MSKNTPKRSPEQKFADALDRLTIRLDQLRAALEREHPVRDCLPIPALELPTQPSDLDRLSSHLCDNLFTEHGHRAQRWIDARTHCPHLTDERVLAINEQIYKWYQLVRAAWHHLTPSPLIPLDMAADSFDHFLREFTASSHKDDMDAPTAHRPQLAGRLENDDDDFGRFLREFTASSRQDDVGADNAHRPQPAGRIEDDDDDTEADR